MLSQFLVRKSKVLAVLVGLLSAVVLVGVIAPSAAAPAPEPTKKEDPRKEEKKEEPKKQAEADPFSLPDLDKLLPPGALDPGQMKELQKMMDELRKQFGQMQRGMPALPGARLRGVPFNRLDLDPNLETRMGASIQSPNATLVDQLNLPEKQGIVLKEVSPDSAAAKAGMKSHDILLELGGKPVPSEPDEFHKMLQDIKPDSTVDAVVLRKGKRETIKDLKLPETKEEPNPFRNFPRLQMLPGGVQRQNLNMIRNADGSFTTSQNQNGVKLTVSGKVENGKAAVDKIEVKDGNETKEYKSVDEVPEAHREAVKNLIQMTEGRGAGIRFNFRQLP
jgi:PDZ domain